MGLERRPSTRDPSLEPARAHARPTCERLRVPEPEAEVPFVFETIRLVRRELAGRVPLIGFAAAPFTLAAYLVEGGGLAGRSSAGSACSTASRPLAHACSTRSPTVTERYLDAQVRAGAQAIQIFDTWAGLASPRRLARVLAPLRAAPGGAPAAVRRAAHLLRPERRPSLRGHPGDGRGRGGRGLAHRARRGLAAPGAFLRAAGEPRSHRAAHRPRSGSPPRRARSWPPVASTPGHVFNLGHGILPDTPVENAVALIDTVRGASVTA